LWRNNEYFEYIGPNRREPSGEKCTVSMFNCQHYGKAISIDQWEETCDYYYNFFPEPYKSKWFKRKGQAIHEISDFGRSLYNWGEGLFSNGYLIGYRKTLLNSNNIDS